jgi:hypothetical protein
MRALLLLLAISTAACGHRPLGEDVELRDIGLEGHYPRKHAVNPDVLFGHRVALSEPVTVQALGVLADSHGYAKLAIFAMDSAADQPGELLTQTVSFELEAPRGEQALPSPLPLSAGSYWIGAIFEGETRLLASDSDDHEMFYEVIDYDQAMPAVITATVVPEYRYALFMTGE